ncbi:MAG: hypothetical protein EPO68_08165, partial [Planctomycetota bacterium]
MAALGPLLVPPDRRADAVLLRGPADRPQQGLPHLARHARSARLREDRAHGQARLLGAVAARQRRRAPAAAAAGGAQVKAPPFGIRIERSFSLLAVLAVVAGLGVGSLFDFGRAAGAHESPPAASATAGAATGAGAAPTAAPRASGALSRLAIAAHAGDADVQRELERIVEHWRAKAERDGSRSKAWRRGDVQVALCVRAEPSGAEVASIGADRALRPASNLKLVTTATALALLGPDAAFRTPLQLQGALDNGVLAGDLVVQGGGDPLHDRADPRYAESRLRDVARALKNRGLSRVRGALVLDEGAFDAPAPGPAWPSASQHWQDYCALSGAFSANGGMLTALVRAGRVGENALAELHPVPSGIPESIGVATVAGGKSDVQVGANARGATVRGALGTSADPVDASFAHPDPVQLFGACLLGALHAEGIEVERGVARERRRWRADLEP